MNGDTRDEIEMSRETTRKLIARARYHLDTFESHGKSYRIALALNNLNLALDEAKWAEEAES